MQELLNIPYGTHLQQKWDLYMPHPPDIGRSAGIIVFVHGGAWRSGDKSEHRALAKGLVEVTGLPVAVPNYRLSPRVTPEASVDRHFKHPTHAQDIALALYEISQSDHLSGTNLNHIYLIGHSCGAHMIASLLLRPPPGEEIAGDDPLARDVYDSVKGVALAEGIYDLDLLLETFPDYRDFVQGAFDNTTASFSQFCVNRYKVRRGITAQWLIIHSSGDTLVDLPQAETMFHHLRSEYLTIGSDPNKIERDFVTLTGDHDEVLTSPEFVRLVKGMI